MIQPEESEQCASEESGDESRKTLLSGVRTPLPVCTDELVEREPVSEGKHEPTAAFCLFCEDEIPQMNSAVSVVIVF